MDAPEPAEMCWGEMQTKRERNTGGRLFLLWQGVAIFLLLICTSPLALAAGINQLANEASGGKGIGNSTSAASASYNDGPGDDASAPVLPGIFLKLVHFVSERNYFLGSLAPDWIPTLFLVLVNYLLLQVQWLISWVSEPHLSVSSKMESVLIKAFAYLFFSTLVVPVLGASSFFKIFSDEANGNESGNSNSAQQNFVLLGSSALLFNFFIQKTFISNATALLALSQTSLFQPWQLARAVTWRERSEAEAMWPYYYGTRYIELLLWH